jgi:hypothetical protein
MSIIFALDYPLKLNLMLMLMWRYGAFTHYSQKRLIADLQKADGLSCWRLLPQVLKRGTGTVHRKTTANHQNG